MTDQVVEVYITDSDGIVQERLTEWNSLTCISRFNKTGSWELELSSDLWIASLISPSTGIHITLDGTTLFSGPGGIEFVKSNENIRIAGTDNNVFLENPTRPTPTLAEGPYPDEYYVLTGVASTVMRALVILNCGVSGAVQWIVPGLTFAGDPLLGGTITARTRFDPLIILLAELASTAVAGGLGFRIVNADAGITITKFFDVYQPQDKHAEIKFGIEMHTAKSFEWVHQEPSANWFIVGGGDQFGINRTIVEGGDLVNIAQVGRRIGQFVDRRGVTDLSELEQELAELIASAVSSDQITVTPVDTVGYKYLEDYQLGDYVSAVVDGVEYARVIREVEMSFNPKEGAIFRPVIADPHGTNDDILARHLETIQHRLSNIERNWTVPDNSIIESMMHETQRTYPGDIKATARSAAQPGWLLCNGADLDRTTYLRLFQAIGTVYGSASGTTFKIPDLRDRFPMGAGTSHFLGESGGSETSSHTHSHSHGGNTLSFIHTHTERSHTHPGSHQHGVGSHTHDFTHTHSIDHDHDTQLSGNVQYTGDAFGRDAGSATGTGHRHNVDLSSISAGSGSASPDAQTGGGSGDTDSDSDTGTFAASWSGTKQGPDVGASWSGASTVDATPAAGSSVLNKYQVVNYEIFTGVVP